MIHAKPSVLFENVSTLGIFIKCTVHFLLVSIAQHRCTNFNINLTINKASISALIDLLVPYIITLRNHCITCQSQFPHVSISDIAHLLIRNRTNKWTVAIDISVYSKNQQFRLFNSIKYGKNIPLVPCITFPFDAQSPLSESELLQKSLITFIEDDHIPNIYYTDKKFVLNSSSMTTSNSIIPIHTNIKIINELIENLYSMNKYADITPYRSTPHSFNTKKNII